MCKSDRSAAMCTLRNVPLSDGDKETTETKRAVLGVFVDHSAGIPTVLPRLSSHIAARDYSRQIMVDIQRTTGMRTRLCTRHKYSRNDAYDKYESSQALHVSVVEDRSSGFG